jgi:hypothetical protein
MDTKNKKIYSTTLTTKSWTRYCDKCKHYFKTEKRHSSECQNCKDNKRLIRIFGTTEIN